MKLTQTALTITMALSRAGWASAAATVSIDTAAGILFGV